MTFNIFQRFRRRHYCDTVDNEPNLLTRFILKKKNKRRFRFLLARPKKRSCDHTTDRELRTDHTKDYHTDRESSSSRGSNSGNFDFCSLNSNEENVAEVGRPPKRLLLRKETLTFKVHGFFQCAKKRGQYCLSPALQAHGCNWRLQLYPLGNHHSNGSIEHLSCFLHYFASPRDRQAPIAKVEYICGVYKTETQVCDFTVEKGKRSCSWGLENFVRRDRVVRNCLDDDGALTIQVNIQIAVDQKDVWYPPTMRQEPTLLQLYHSIEETGDATFRLALASNKDGSSLTRSASSSSNCRYYKAHKMILALRARILYELVCEESLPEDEEEECDSATAVDLPGVDPATFEALLEHIYTVKQPTIRDEGSAKALLIASDRFCLTDLKMYLESVLVDRFASSSNAASLLLFADSHSCALLKERTMDLYVNDPSTVICTASWPLVEESKQILSELSKHVHTSSYLNFHQNNDLGRLDVFSMRERLVEHGLAVDGSRETLLGRLRTLQGPGKNRERSKE